MFRVKGKVKNIFFPKAGQISTNDFYIFALGDVEVISGDVYNLSFTKYNTLSVQGNLSECVLGKTLELDIEFKSSDMRFGTSYKIVDEILSAEIHNFEDLKSFLYSLDITDRQANNLLEDENVIDHIKNGNVEALTKLRGIGEHTANRIINKYQENKEVHALYEELYKLGFDSLNHRVKIVKHYQNKIISYYRAKHNGEEPSKKYLEKAIRNKISEIKENPYILLEVDGFGLKTVDDIALTYLKIPYNSEFRIEKFIEYILQLHGNNGRSYLAYNDFLKELKKNIESIKEGNITVQKAISEELIKEVLSNMESNDKVLIAPNFSAISLKYFYDLEMEVRNELIRIHENVNKKFDNKDKDNIIKDLENEQGFELSEEQKSAVYTMTDTNNGVTILTGFAGTGKSTVMSAVHRIFENYTIWQGAFSGKASQRISETTGRESSTIHMHLAKLKTAEEEVKYDVYIVDEASMIHLELIRDLLKTIPNGSKLIIIGDEGQLQALTTGNLLADIINSNRFPVARLTTVYRQGLKSGILLTSVKVRNQEQLCKRGYVGEFTIGEKEDLNVVVRDNNLKLAYETLRAYDKYFRETENVLDIQILSPVKERGDLSVKALNNTVQEYLKPYLSKEFFKVKDLMFHIGDKVINTKNNYRANTEDDEKTAVYNGSIGVVLDFIRNDNRDIVGLKIDFLGSGVVLYEGEDCNKLNLAYAITVHSSQGSEFKNVIYAISMASYTLLNKENIYTGVTRAKKHCTIVAENVALYTAINNCEKNTKKTFLKDFLIK